MLWRRLVMLLLVMVVSIIRTMMLPVVVSETSSARRRCHIRLMVLVVGSRVRRCWVQAVLGIEQLLLLFDLLLSQIILIKITLRQSLWRAFSC